MFKPDQRIEIGDTQTILKSLYLGDEKAGIYLADTDGHTSFFHYGIQFPRELNDVQSLMRFQTNGDQLLVSSKCSLVPFDDNVWRALTKIVMVKSLINFVEQVGRLHDKNIWLHGIRKKELFWNESKNEIVLAAYSRVRKDMQSREETVWRDFKILSVLLYEGFQNRAFPGGHEIASWLQDRDNLQKEGLMYPGVTQFLAGAVSPYGDLAFTSWEEIKLSLVQIVKELDQVSGVVVGQHSTIGNYIFRKNNQDSCGFIQLGSICGSNKHKSGFFCVADGIGGIQDGEKASGLTVESACSGFARAWANLGTEGLAEAPTYYARLIAKHVGQRLAAEGEFLPDENRGGTTLSGMIIADDRAGICHVGDSRIVLVRNGILYALTRDHTLATILSKLGEKTEEEIANDDLAQRTISRFMSTSAEVDFDRIDAFCEDAKANFPEIGTSGYLTIKKDDVFIFTSDGAHGETDDDGILAIVMDNRDEPQIVAEALTQNAVAKFGRDNSTAIVVLVL